MKTWKIAKEFNFCYGHSVHNQSLIKEYSLETSCKCKHLHGHEGKLIVFLEANELKDGFVTDFKHLNWFGKFIDDTLDHKMIIDYHDPGIQHIIPNWSEVKEHLMSGTYRGYTVIDPMYINTITDNRLKELLEGFVIVLFVPTSENLSQWLFNIAQHKMVDIDVKVSGIRFFETPKSQSNYFETN